MIKRERSEQAPIRVQIFVLSFAGAFLFLYLRTFLFSGVPFAANGDQMLFFARSLHVLHGWVLYRDIFELVTPGTDLLYAAIFGIFGVHAWVIQACGLVFGVATFAVMTQIARRILQGPLVLLPGTLFLVFDFNSALDMTHHWYSTLAVLGAVSVLMGRLSSGRIVCASLLCALATLFTQTQGALAFAALLAYLVWFGHSSGETRRQRFVTFVLPFGVTLLGVLGYYAYRSGWNTFFFDLIEFPMRYLSSDEVNSPRTYLHQFPPVHSLGDLFRSVPFIFIYAVVPYAYVAGFYRLWRNGNKMPVDIRQRLLLLHFAGLGLFLAVANAPRFFRLCTVAPPAILVCVWLLSERGLAQKCVRSLLWVTAVVFAIVLPLRRQTQWHGVLDLPIGRTAFFDRQDFDEFQWLAQRTQPSNAFFNKTSLSLYLALDTPAAAEFINDEDFTRPEQVRTIVEWMKSRQPRFLVMYPKGPRYSDHSNSAPFRRYFEQNYHLVRVFPLIQNTWHEEMWELGSVLPNRSR